MDENINWNLLIDDFDESRNISVNYLDDFNTLSLKYANYYQIPKKYLFVITSELNYNNLMEWNQYLSDCRFVPIPKYLYLVLKDEHDHLQQLTNLIRELSDINVNYLESIIVWYYKLFTSNYNNIIPRSLDELSQIINTLMDEFQMARISKGLLNDHINNIIREDYRTFIKNEGSYIREMIEEQQRMLSINPLKNSKLNIRRVEYSGRVVFPEDMDIDDGINFFNYIKADIKSPVIIYNDGQQNYYKIYQGRYDKEISSYDSLLDEQFDPKDKDILIIKTITDKDKLTDDNTFVSFLNFQSQRIYFQTKRDIDKQIMVDILKELLLCDIVDIEEEKIIGDFHIYDVNLINPIFYHLIYSNYYNYMFIDETITPIADKRKINIRMYYPNEDPNIFNNKKSLTILHNFHQEDITNPNIITYYSVEDQQLRQVEYPNGYTSVRFNFDGHNQFVVEYIIYIMTRILSQYINDYENVIPYYSIVSNFLRNEEIKKVEKANNKIQRLKQMFPDVFVGKYARSCSKKQQPVVIDGELINDWLEQNDYNYEDHILPFRYRDNDYYFRCDSDVYIYPKMKNGRPCCFQKPDTTSEKRTSRIIKNILFLTEDKIGELPTNLNQILSYVELPPLKLTRLGVVPKENKNNLLHCLLRIRYPRLTFNEREQQIINIRRHFSTKYHPALVKQEMYDFHDDDIRQMVGNPDVYFDPDIFYRYVEEYFKINLFIFSDQLIIPRHKFYHIRPMMINENPTVVLFRLYKTTVETRKYPEYDIIQYNGNNLIYGETMYKYLLSILYGSQIIYNIDLSTSVLSYQNQYQYLNYNHIIRQPYKQLFKMVSQGVDTYGKLRLINIMGNIDNKQVQFSIMGNPSQPMNLPVITSNNEIYRISRELLSTIIPVKPSTISIINDMIQGFWFPILDNPYGIYIPVIPYYNTGKISIKYPTRYSPFQFNNKELIDNINREGKLRKDINILFQIIIWLYQIYEFHYMSNDKSLNDFMNYFTIIPFDNDSVYFYDFGNINQKFITVDEVNDMEDIINYLERIPTLIENRKIRLYSQKMKDSIIYYLQQFNNNYSLKSKMKMANKIYRLFENESDFIQHTNNFIFIGDDKLNQWKSSMGYGIEMVSYITSFDDDLKNPDIERKEPFFYNINERFYIVQNVDGNIYSALNVSYNWYTSIYNPGYYTKEINKNVPYILYNIDEDKQLVPIQSNSTPVNDFLEVLTYGNNKYAALLPINKN